MKAALLLVALSSLQVGESIELVARHAQGDVFEEKESFWRSSSGAALEAEANKPAFDWNEAGVSAGQRADDPLGASDSTILDEVLSVKDGVRVKVKRTFVVRSTTDSTAAVEPGAGDPTPHPQTAMFEGQTVILVADGDGTRIVGELQGEEELEASDLRLSSRWEQVLPGMPVAVGDTWSLSTEVAQQLLERMSIAKATAWCTLLGVDASRSGKTARIALEIRATAAAEFGASAEIEASGVLLWSVEAGHLMELALSGEIRTANPEGSDQTSRFGISHETRKIE